MKNSTNMRPSTLKKAEVVLGYLADQDFKLPRFVSRDRINDLREQGLIHYPSWLLRPENKTDQRGIYRVVDPTGKFKFDDQSSNDPANEVLMETVVPIDSAKERRLRTNSAGFSDNLIPKKDPLFVPFGHYEATKSVVESGKFFPIFITGLSGNGKTYMVKQICAETTRKFVRVNLTAETDEDDLIGGLRLVEDETAFFKGPVIRAMEEGAILLLDEIDLANPSRIMCLQSILEGSGYFIKKTGEFVEPKEGFNIVATANTKGKGSDTGQFAGVNILNEAFLERFPVTFEQPYPEASIEERILEKVFSSLGMKVSDTREFVKNLVSWAEIVRKTYYEDAIDDIIATRRLVHIAEAYAIFKRRDLAINYCINRFEDETKTAFLDLYKKLDVNFGKSEKKVTPTPVPKPESSSGAAKKWQPLTAAENEQSGKSYDYNAPDSRYPF